MPNRPHDADIRTADEADLAELQALSRRTIDASYRRFLGDELVDGFIDSGAADAHVATYLRRGAVRCLHEHDEIVGLVILDDATLELMMVDPRRHRQGLGRRLLRYAETVLFADHTVIRLESFADNSTANAFYEAGGWSRSRLLKVDGPAKVEYTKRR